MTGSMVLPESIRIVLSQDPLEADAGNMCREKAIAEMLRVAAEKPKSDWRSYSECKRMIAHVPFTSRQYEAVIERLVDILEV